MIRFLARAGRTPEVVQEVLADLKMGRLYLLCFFGNIALMLNIRKWLYGSLAASLHLVLFQACVLFKMQKNNGENCVSKFALLKDM